MMNYKIKNFFNNWKSFITNHTFKLGEFIVFLFSYILHKFDWLNLEIWKSLSNIINLISNIRFKAVASLVRSRGRLARRYRYLFIISLSIMLFFLGGIFQSRLVDQDVIEKNSFLSSNYVFYEKASASTLSAEKILLDQPVEHEVKEGESLQDISKKYNISLESVKFANNLTANTVTAGQILKIPPVEGTLHTVGAGDTLEKLSKRYNVPVQTIVDFNYIDSPYILSEGQVLTIPDAQRPETKKYYAGSTVYDLSSYGVIPYAGDVAQAGEGKFIWPLSGVLTQFFGRYHPGLDIANRTGDIIATDKGIVIRSGWWEGGYGNAVQVDHGNGYVTTYAHMSSIAVSVGDEVDRGQKLGVVGSTGRSTGPHLHFTIQLEGKYLDPLSVLP
jgi:murein DD-endopeptidase MepM/ murein hydrolase activator NlpD